MTKATQLFDASLLTSPQLPSHLILRPLESTDLVKGYDTILHPLATGQTPLTQEVFDEVFHEMSQPSPRVHYVVVIVDSSAAAGDRIVASATLLYERKFLRAGATAGHIEDVVVSPSHQGQKLGRVLIDALSLLAKQLGCYKIILDCSEDNVGFYEKCGYTAKGVEMKLYV